MALYNVFISHRHEDDDLVVALKLMLSRRGCVLRNSSVTADDPDPPEDAAEIKLMLASKIRWAGAILVIVSSPTRDHDWVEWEIEQGSRYVSKKIVGVRAPGDETSPLPAALVRYADAVVTWDADDIIRALESKVDESQTDSSTTRTRAGAKSRT